MRSFVTGSWTYGTVHEESDVDLVIQVSPNDRRILEILADSTEKGVRFGNLNLIICETDDEMAMWKAGTRYLAENGNRGVGARDRAVRLFQRLKEILKLRLNYDTKPVDDSLNDNENPYQAV